MAEPIPPNGVWKGLAMNDTAQVQIEMHLRFEAGSVQGQYEMPELKQGASQGDLKGTYISGGAIVLEANSGMQARLEGTILQAPNGKWLIHGLVRRSKGSSQIVGITVFFTPQKVVTFQSAYEADQFGGQPGPPERD